jgi:hypothetical protein
LSGRESGRSVGRSTVGREEKQTIGFGRKLRARARVGLGARPDSRMLIKPHRERRVEKKLSLFNALLGKGSTVECVFAAVVLRPFLGFETILDAFFSVVVVGFARRMEGKKVLCESCKG